MQNGRTSKLILTFLCAMLFIACDLFYSPPGVLQSSRQAGTYLEPIAITLLSNHSKAIHYTTDGSLPTLDSPRYTTPITLSKTTRVQAIAIDSNDKVTQRLSWDYVVRGTPHFSPTLSVAEQRIYHVSDQYEYSTDDGNTWQACTGLSQTLTSLSVGNMVHVRHKVVQDDSYYLGEVFDLTGPDLVAGNCYIASANLIVPSIHEWSAQRFDADLSDGTATIAIPTITNASNATFTGSAIIDFYASSDPFITEEDQLFLSVETIDFTLDPNQTYGASQDGSWPANGNWLLGLLRTEGGFPVLNYHEDVFLEGFQYIGFHLRTVESELLKQNNWTTSQHVDSIFFSESEADTTDGAFKMVNSWGVGGRWEHIPDGAYYLPFDAAVALKMHIYYSLNTVETVYEPFLLASFDLSHPNRETCLVSIGVGDPEHPLMEKRLQSISDINNVGLVRAGGPNPYPDTTMVMDISEFAPYIATNDIFIRIDNRDEGEEATLSSFLVELYDEYSIDPADAAYVFPSALGSSATVVAEQNSTFLVRTSVDLEQEHLSLLHTQSRSMTQPLPIQRPLSEEEIQAILALQAPASRSSRSQDDFASKGLVPPTEVELRSMRTLDVGTRWYPGDLPLEVDWSQSPYFPPIGNQGVKGSCSAFTSAYYIHTFSEAREHGWDLSGAEWEGTGSGYPSVEYQDRIMSPDFSYHLTSQAPGSSIAALQSVLDRIGSSTWKTTGYDVVNDEDPSSDYEYPWPTEEAFREAAQYRSRRSDGNYFDENSVGLIVLDDPAKLDIVQQLLASGYCLATSIHAQSFYASEHQWMNEQDVVDLAGVTEADIVYSSRNPNHAQTIVGYKSGLAWSP